MIDCHAHAYPTLDYQASRLAPRVPRPAAALMVQGGAALDAAFGALRRWTAGGKPALGVEQLAEMRARRSERANQLIESAMSVLALPALVATGSLQRLLESMDRFGIERTVVIGAPPVATNDWLLDEAIALAGERIVPVATLPPDTAEDAPEADWVEAWSAAADAGARGFKIHLNMDGLPPEHSAYRALFEVASERGLFVIAHTGCFHVPAYKSGEPVEPYVFEPLLSDYPDVRVCLAHMNRAHPERAWEVMKRFPQVFTDTSWQPAEAIRGALDAIGGDRILLGSDWPLLHGDLQGEAIDLLRRAAGDEAAERIATDNARVFLGD